MLITMSTEKALNLVQEHRQEHIDEFANQIQGWKKAMEIFGAKLVEWKNNTSEDIFETEHKENRRPSEPTKPQNFVKDYDDLVLLLKYHEGQLIELNEHEFNKIVKNEFGWQGTFMANSATYSN